MPRAGSHCRSSGKTLRCFTPPVPRVLLVLRALAEVHPRTPLVLDSRLRRAEPFTPVALIALGIGETAELTPDVTFLFLDLAAGPTRHDGAALLVGNRAFPCVSVNRTAAPPGSPITAASRRVEHPPPPYPRQCPAAPALQTSPEHSSHSDGRTHHCNEHCNEHCNPASHDE